ncbi:MAG: Maf family protein [Dehalococcoidia bacterium]
MSRVVLASASPRRRELLRALVDEFAVVPADVEEVLKGDPVDEAVRLAEEKARIVAQGHPETVVIGSDTVVFDDRRAYGKPGDEDDAAAMLRDLSGREHRVVTAVAVARPGGKVASAVSVATVRLRALGEDEVRAYVASGIPLDKAGAYAIQHDEFPVVAAMEGCYCTVVGLPLWALRRLLEDAGIRCGDPGTTFERCRSCPDRVR